MRIRRATQEDWPDIRRLLRFALDELREGFGTDGLDELSAKAISFGIENNEAVLVAENEKADIVGWCAWVGGMPGFASGTAYGVGTYVLPHYRRTGVCDEMRAQAARICKEAGYLRVEGQIHKDNAAGVRSCEKAGFQTQAFVMVKTL